MYGSVCIMRATAQLLCIALESCDARARYTQDPGVCTASDLDVAEQLVPALQCHCEKTHILFLTEHEC